MADWGAGYVTDVNYIPGYYVQQSPVHMVAAARLVGIACDLPESEDEVHFLELGCGLGLVSLILAAANPGWRVTGIDFNPAHIAAARAFARQADIANAVFIEADLAGFAESAVADEVPQADFVSIHGVWSWVSAAVRAGIVRLLRDKVRAGGIVHLSYNALPGWQGRLGMQRLVRIAGNAAQGRSDRRALAGFDILRALHTAGARRLAGSGDIGALLERLAELPVAYLAHEFMNAHWQPCFHADVAEALAAARLEWIGSGDLLENFPELTLTEAQREIYNRIDDPFYRELVKDLCVERGLRHDLFVRGAQRLSAADRNAALGEVALMATVSADDFQYEIRMAEGKAELARDFYGAMAQALAAGPRTVAELLALPEAAGRGDKAAELTGILIGTGQAAAMLRPGAPQAGPAAALNRLLAEGFGRIEHRTTPLALASTAIGGGLPASAFELFVQSRLAQGEDERALETWVAALGTELDAAAQQQLRELFQRIVNRRVPIFRSAGVL
jgi:SAM-dependent methyltransferase